MKIGKRDFIPITPKPRRGNTKPRERREDVLALEEAAERIGLSPSGLQHRMRRYNLTLEEAVAWQPTPRSVSSRRGKARSYWRHLGDIARGRDV